MPHPMVVPQGQISLLMIVAIDVLGLKNRRLVPGAGRQHPLLMAFETSALLQDGSDFGQVFNLPHLRRRRGLDVQAHGALPVHH